MYKIQLLNNIAQRGLDCLPPDRFVTGQDVASPDAILVRSADLHALDLPPSIKAIGRAGAGTNNIPVARLSRLGVPVFNAPGANANAVKELVVAGMLIAARRLDQALAFVGSLAPASEHLEHEVEAGKKRFVGIELPGRTLGVIGLGAIGVRIANAARALGMRVLGYDPQLTVDGAWRLSSEVERAGSLQELYARSDFVTIHVPLVEGTRGMLGRSAFAAMRPGVVVLNFAREAVVDEQALLEALNDRRVDRYVSDFPTAALLGHPQVIALPHLGASTGEAEENCAVMVAEQVRDYLEHGNIRNAVNLPSLVLARDGAARLSIANDNKPNMIGQLSHVLGEAGLNIVQMQNASRGELAYTLIDLEQHPDQAIVQAIAAIDGVLAVRLI